MTSAIILAAGLGRRLQAVSDLPKWLVPVGASTPAAVQLDAIDRLPAVDEVVVVTGPRSDAIEDFLDRRPPATELRFVANPDYDRWNNWHSLELAIQATPERDLLVLNSDLFSSVTWLAETASALLAAGDAALAVDLVKPLTDEAMKVGVGPDGGVTRIGKVGIDDPHGEYVGMSRWRSEAAADLLGHLAAYAERTECHNNWYEHGIDDHMATGSPYDLVPVPSSEWVEIDDPADLDAAAGLA